MESRLIILLILLPFLKSQPLYFNTPLNKSSGLFYNELGHAKLTNSKLILISYLNISHFHDTLKTLNNQFAKTANICHNTDKRDHITFYCASSLNILRSQLNRILEKNEMLSHLVRSDNIALPGFQRSKRGLINGVSYALNWLFGTPDAADAKYYTESIDNLVNDNKQTQTLLKSQIQIISSTIKNFNSSVVALQRNEQTMNYNIDSLNKLSTKVKSGFENLTYESTIIRQFTYLTTLTSKLNEDYDNCIDALNLGKHGIVSPQLLSPKELFEEIVNYKGNDDLPLVPGYNTVHQYYKIISMDVVLHNHLIIFAFKIPLVKKITYTLYNLIPTPILNKNTSQYVYIQPKHPYLLISQSKALYSYLHDITLCSEWMSKEYLCREIQLTKRNNEESCEVILLSPHITQIPKDCQIVKLTADLETWHHIGPNEWIYVLHRPTTITVMCEKNNITEVVLRATGLFKLQQGCRGYSNEYILEASSEVRKNTSHYLPQIDLLEDDCCFNENNQPKEELIRFKPVRLTNVNLDELKYTETKLNELDHVLTQQMEHPFMSRKTQWYTICFSIIGTVLVFIVCANCCRWCGCVKLFQKLCCFVRAPRNGIVPPVFRTIVAETFRRNAQVPVNEPLNELENEVMAGPVLNEVPRPLETVQRYELRSLSNRKSTTPI